MNRFAIPVLFFCSLLCFAVSPNASADDLFAFGDNLDKLAVGLTPEEVVALLGEPSTLNHTDSGLSFVYLSGDYAGVDIGFKKRATGPGLSNIVFTDAFARKTASGIGLGMHRVQVQARIGAPAFEVDIKTKFWESYVERGFVVHVEYDLDGMVTNLIKVDRASVDVPALKLAQGPMLQVEVTSSDENEVLTFEGTYFENSAMASEQDFIESRQTPYRFEIAPQDVVLLFHQLTGDAELSVKVLNLAADGQMINGGRSIGAVALMIFDSEANVLRVTGF
ncbi:MAG: hypothetical protein AAF564_03190 [Bacteroidota bacterium]